MQELVMRVVEKTKSLINNDKQLIIIDSIWRIYIKDAE